MRATLFVLVFGLALLAGCKTRGLHEHDPIVDHSVDLGTPDLAMSSRDLAAICELDTATSQLSFGSDLLPYVTIGDVDQGGEGACGPPGEAVTLYFSRTPLSSSTTRLSILLVPPFIVGNRFVGVFDDASLRTFEATLSITRLTARPDSELPDAVEGMLRETNEDFSGSFTAAHCPLFDVTCI